MTTQDAPAPEAPVRRQSGAASAYVLAVLTLTYVLNFMDRYAIVSMAEQIKADLALSDSQVGLLTGFAFSLVYACLGLPVAMLADRIGFVRVIAGSVALWSVMTALGSRASGFATLAMSRFGVGVGEAGGTPPAHAIISSIFSGRSLPVAIGIYSTGSGIGLAIGLSLGGHLAVEHGWRTAMLLLGLPGVAVALLVLATLREPEKVQRRARIDWGELAGDAMRSLKTPRLGRLAAAMSFAAFVGFANLGWLTPLCVRRFGEGNEAAAALGHAIGLANIFGVFSGGLLASFLKSFTHRASYLICAIAVLLAAPAFLAVYLSASSAVFVACAGAGVFLHSLILAPVMTEAQVLARRQDKALASAVMLFCINIFGAGAGPFVVGLLSDAFSEFGPERALALSLMMILVSYLVAAVLFFFASPRRPAEHAA